MSLRLLTPPGSSDVQLARRAAAGDDDAFATLYARYEPRLYAYCRSIVRHEEDARDAVQNAMTKALVALRRDTSALNVQAWLFRIAHNESITLLRRRRPTSELPEAFCDRALDPPGDVLVREELRAMLDGVRALPGRLQQPLLLRELAGMSYGQVAAVTGGTPASARKAVFEARSALSADRAGRDETCAVIREALSDGDGRRRRARIVRGHLRACAGCRSWEHELRARRQRFASLVPAAGLAAGSLWTWAAGLVGSGAGGTAIAGIGGSGVAANAKLAAAVLVVAAGATTPVVTKQEPSVRNAVRAVVTAGPSSAQAKAADTAPATTPAAPSHVALARPARSAAAASRRAGERRTDSRRTERDRTGERRPTLRRERDAAPATAAPPLRDRRRAASIQPAPECPRDPLATHDRAIDGDPHHGGRLPAPRPGVATYPRLAG